MIPNVFAEVLEDISVLINVVGDFFTTFLSRVGVRTPMVPEAKTKESRLLSKEKKKVYEALMKRARFTFFFGLSLFGASLSWLIANVAKLAYGAIPVYEALVPLALLIVSSVLVITYADIEFLVDRK